MPDSHCQPLAASRDISSPPTGRESLLTRHLKNRFPFWEPGDQKSISNTNNNFGDIAWVSPTVRCGEQVHLNLALTGVVQWAGHCPINEKVSGSISGQGIGLGCGPGPQSGACERQLSDVSLAHQCFSFPSPL